MAPTAIAQTVNGNGVKAVKKIVEPVHLSSADVIGLEEKYGAHK